MDERDDLPTGAELAELMAYEPPHNPPPPALPVRKRFYLTKCPHCHWVGSSEQCGTEPGDDSDVWCPVCHSPGCEADPTLTESEEHGEEVYQRLAAAGAALQQVTAERDEAQRMRRWNIDRTGDGEVLVCRGHHDKGEDCDHERFVPEERLATATAEAALLRAEVEAKDRALKEERARRKAAVQSVREKSAALCDEAAAYFDRTTGHYDRAQAAGGYRATASKIRLLTPDRTALARAATAREGQANE